MNLCEKLLESNQDILQIKTCDILAYYRSITEEENTKVLPLLKHLQQYYSKQKEMIKAAHTSFLIAYCYLIPCVLNRERPAKKSQVGICKILPRKKGCTNPSRSASRF